MWYLNLHVLDGISIVSQNVVMEEESYLRRPNVLSALRMRPRDGVAFLRHYSPRLGM